MLDSLTEGNVFYSLYLYDLLAPSTSNGIEKSNNTYKPVLIVFWH